MPHIIIEHTKDIKTNINLMKLNQDLHSGLSKQETIKLSSIKTRSIEVDNVIVGSDENSNFMHINLLLLPGRSDELKKSMANCLFEIAEKYLSDIDCLLSVNISDLGIYKK